MDTVTINQKQSSGGVLTNFTKFMRKLLRWGLAFNEVAEIQRATLSKKRHKCFLLNFVKFLRTSFL